MYKIRNRIKVCRAELDWTQADLADKLSTNRQSIACIEAGKHQPTIGLAIAIAHALGKDINEVFRLEEEN